jgi:hypothetical protein
MPQVEDASWAKSWCHVTSISISRQLWTCGEWLNKFMDPNMHFESWWTQVTYPYKLMDLQCILLSILLHISPSSQPPTCGAPFFFSFLLFSNLISSHPPHQSRDTGSDSSSPHLSLSRTPAAAPHPYGSVPLPPPIPAPTAAEEQRRHTRSVPDPVLQLAGLLLSSPAGPYNIAIPTLLDGSFWRPPTTAYFPPLPLCQALAHRFDSWRWEFEIPRPPLIPGRRASSFSFGTELRWAAFPSIGDGIRRAGDLCSSF